MSIWGLIVAAIIGAIAYIIVVAVGLPTWIAAVVFLLFLLAALTGNLRV